MADFREKVAGRPEGAAALLPSAWILNKAAGLSDEERISRNDWEKIKLSYRKQITGSGGSEAEMKQIEKSFEGAKTPAEQRAAIDEADAFFKRIETSHRASVDPRANAIYNAQSSAISPQIPGSVRIKTGSGDTSDERAKQFKKKLSGGGLY